MANSGDKITSWSDLYDAINRVIELPATGSATAFEGTTVLDNTNVAVGDKIDDDDLNNLIDRYNALKTDSLYGSSDQLDTNHASTTVSLYATNPNNTSAGSLLQIQSENDVQAIVNSLNNIQCRNIVSCYKQESNYCANQSCYQCYDSYGVGCNNRYCDDSFYLYYCHKSGVIMVTDCDRCPSNYVGCSDRYYVCGNYAQYSGCNQTTYYYSNTLKHNDIQCLNTSWGGN